MSKGFAVSLFIFGIAMLAPGVVLLARPRAAAKWNDTTGSAWLRNVNRAAGQTSKPWQMVIAGAALVFAGSVTVLVALTYVGFNPLHLT